MLPCKRSMPPSRPPSRTFSGLWTVRSAPRKARAILLLWRQRLGRGAMPRVSAAFFVTGGLLLLSGMMLGEYMGAHENFTLSPLHAHINLLGWVTLALYGTFYTLTKDTYSL